jgi:hypothetical protein
VLQSSRVDKEVLVRRGSPAPPERLHSLCVKRGVHLRLSSGKRLDGVARHAFPIDAHTGPTHLRTRRDGVETT